MTAGSIDAVRLRVRPPPRPSPRPARADLATGPGHPLDPVPDLLARDFAGVPTRAVPGGRLQAKLVVGSSGDVQEQEADRIAAQVMREPAADGDSPCACGGECSKCASGPAAAGRPDRIQTRRVGSGDLAPEVAPAIVDDVLRSPGQSLDPGVRSLMEPRFGRDFAGVRIHTGSRAADSAAAVKALAYTVGDHIVFGGGQHAPGSVAGRSLLAHELAHVVQQTGGSPSGAGVIRRQPTSDEKERTEKARQAAERKTSEATRDLTVKKHLDQQQRAVDFMEKGRKIRIDPKTTDLRDPDSLFHNTVEMFDSGKFTLTVLSPTHYDQTRHFDLRVRHPKIGGTYSADPRIGAGLHPDAKQSFGEVQLHKAPMTMTTTNPKVEETRERVPVGKAEPKPATSAPKAPPAVPTKAPAAPPVPAPFSPSDVFLFTRGLDLSEGGFRNTLVHEAQHIADLSPKDERVTGWQDVLEGYKSEFRAFWIQPPPPPPQGGIVAEEIDRLPEPTGKVDNSGKVDVPDPTKCKLCSDPGPSAKAFVDPTIAMTNPRQAKIFWHIMAHYEGYRCCFVHNRQFHDAVNRFVLPESVNVVNSVRILDLTIEVQRLKPAMPAKEVGPAIVALVTRLQPLDWVFLRDPKMSKPFWDLLKATAPAFVSKAVQALATTSAKKAVSADDVSKALSGR